MQSTEPLPLISKPIMNKLSLAKEMYNLGLNHKKKYTRSDKILAILNFDFAVVTLIVVSCLESRES